MSLLETNSNDKQFGAKRTVVASGRGYSWRVATKNANPASPASRSSNYFAVPETAQTAQQVLQSTDQNILAVD